MIDWACVKTLVNEIGEEDFDDVVPLFLEEMDESISTLLSSREGGTLAETLHFLKGSSLNLGFLKFSAMCVAAENACKSGVGDRIDIAALEAAYQKSRSEFVAGLEKGIPA